MQSAFIVFHLHFYLLFRKVTLMDRRWFKHISLKCWRWRQFLVLNGAMSYLLQIFNKRCLYSVPTSLFYLVLSVPKFDTKNNPFLCLHLFNNSLQKLSKIQNKTVNIYFKVRSTSTMTFLHITFPLINSTLKWFVNSLSIRKWHKLQVELITEYNLSLYAWSKSICTEHISFV